MSAPVLEMLWEADDPHQALQQRFGFGDARSAAGWVSAALAEHWGVQPHSCQRIVISDRNALAWVSTSAGRRVVKWSVASDRFARLMELARVTHWLQAHPLPVSAPILALDGRPQVEFDGVSMGLQREIDGGLLDTADTEQVRAAGAVLAGLHDALASYPASDRITELARPARPLAARITGWIESAPEQLPAAAGQLLGELVAEAPAEPLPVQLVHNDYRSANILCAGGEVVGVIDFEQAGFDHRLVEVARSAVLLGTRFQNWGPVSAEVHAAFLAGYQSVRPLTAAETHWWDTLLLQHAWAVTPAGDDPTGWRSAALSLQARLIAGHG